MTRKHCSRVVMSREMFGLLQKLIGDIFVTARLSLIFVAVVLIWQSASNSRQKTPESSRQASVFRRPCFATLQKQQALR